MEEITEISDPLELTEATLKKWADMDELSCDNDILTINSLSSKVKNFLFKSADADTDASVATKSLDVLMPITYDVFLDAQCHICQNPFHRHTAIKILIATRRFE